MTAIIMFLYLWAQDKWMAYRYRRLLLKRAAETAEWNRNVQRRNKRARRGP